MQCNRDKHRHAHCNNMVVHSTYIQRNLHAQQSATLKTIVANSPAATTAAIAQDCNEQDNKAPALTSLATRTTWVFRNTQCVQCHQTMKLSSMQLVRESVYRRQMSSTCSIQRSQVVTTNTLRTVQHTIEDNTWMTTWQLRINWMRTYRIAASAANRRVQNKMH